MTPCQNILDILFIHTEITLCCQNHNRRAFGFGKQGREVGSHFQNCNSIILCLEVIIQLRIALRDRGDIFIHSIFTVSYD